MRSYLVSSEIGAAEQDNPPPADLSGNTQRDMTNIDSAGQACTMRSLQIQRYLAGLIRADETRQEERSKREFKGTRVTRRLLREKAKPKPCFSFNVSVWTVYVFFVDITLSEGLLANFCKDQCICLVYFRRGLWLACSRSRALDLLRRCCSFCAAATVAVAVVAAKL